MKLKKEAITKLPKNVLLAADVGGTNTRIALCTLKNNKVNFHVKYYFTNNKLRNFKQAVDFVKKDSKTKISAGVIAVAGPVSEDRKESKLTNFKWRIKTKDLPFKAILINDMEAAGYSINVMENKDIKTVKKGLDRGRIGLISVGTGLGKSFLIYDKKNKFYKPYSSEGGHADISVFDKNLLKYINAKKLTEYEDLISGRGLAKLYQYYSKKKKTPAEIMRTKNEAATRTKQTFSELLGRCARGFALDLMAKGGIYLGGGVISKNLDLINSIFIKEFVKSKTMERILEKISLKVIINEDLCLLGAAFAAKLLEEKRI